MTVITGNLDRRQLPVELDELYYRFGHRDVEIESRQSHVHRRQHLADGAVIVIVMVVVGTRLRRMVIDRK